MLNKSDDLKNILRNDTIPRVSKNVRKDLEIYFPSLDLTIVTEKIVDDSFSLEESLFTESSIKFGACEAAQISFTVADIDHELKGLDFIINQKIGNEIIELGKYKVASSINQDDLRFKDITAYNYMKRFDIDVAAWYNSLQFPLSLAQFRASLCDYVGIEEDVVNLPNDNMVITKTIEPTQLPGREVLICIEEINGVFGQVNRYGKLTHVVLNPYYGLYPAETLYPEDTLFLEYGTEVCDKSMYRSVRFEDFTVKAIDKLQIRQEEDDIGCIVGDGTNVYVIEGNFLVFGKSASELETIALNTFENIKDRPYRPFKSENIGLPYIEVGDAIAYGNDDSVVSYVFKRTLTGIQALSDNYSASGTEEAKQEFGVNKQIIQLQGKAAIIKKTVEELSNTVIDLQEETQSQFTQTAQNIELKVDKAGIISTINLSSEGVSINASKINLTGYATFYSLFAQGESVINGSNIRTGTLDAQLVNVINIKAENITSGTINGVNINSSGTAKFNEITLQGTSSSTWISGPQIETTFITTTYLSTTYINGYTPVTSGNLSSYLSTQYVYGIKNPSGFYNAYVSINENIIPSSSGGMGIGSSPNRFNNGYFNNVYNSAGIITSSDRRIKNHIKPLDIRYLELAKKLKPCIFQYENGTSGRYHPGFIAQEVEEVMNECEISDIEFSGLIRNPVYSKMIDGDYDLTSEIVDYEYGLRKEDLIPLIFLWLADIEERLGA